MSHERNLGGAKNRESLEQTRQEVLEILDRLSLADDLFLAAQESHDPHVLADILGKKAELGYVDAELLARIKTMIPWSGETTLALPNDIFDDPNRERLWGYKRMALGLLRGGETQPADALCAYQLQHEKRDDFWALAAEIKARQAKDPTPTINDIEATILKDVQTGYSISDGSLIGCAVIGKYDPEKGRALFDQCLEKTMREIHEQAARNPQAEFVERVNVIDNFLHRTESIDSANYYAYVPLHRPTQPQRDIVARFVVPLRDKSVQYDLPLETRRKLVRFFAKFGENPNVVFEHLAVETDPFELAAVGSIFAEYDQCASVAALLQRVEQMADEEPAEGQPSRKQLAERWLNALLATQYAKQGNFDTAKEFLERSQDPTDAIMAYVEVAEQLVQSPQLNMQPKDLIADVVRRIEQRPGDPLKQFDAKQLMYRALEMTLAYANIPESALGQFNIRHLVKREKKLADESIEPTYYHDQMLQLAETLMRKAQKRLDSIPRITLNAILNRQRNPKIRLLVHQYLDQQ